MANKPPPREVDAPPKDFASTTPRDLYQMSDIRLVMQEVAKLSTQVDRLISDVKSLDSKVNPGQIERLIDDVKTVTSKVDEVQHTVSYMRGALKTVGIFFAAVIAIAGLLFAGLRLLPAAPPAASPTTVAPPATPLPAAPAKSPG